MAGGSCSNVSLPGKGMAPGILFWHLPGRTKGSRALVTVNYDLIIVSAMSICLLLTWQARQVRFRDLMSPAVYERNGSELLSKGLYLDLPAWGYHIFEVVN